MQCQCAVSTVNIDVSDVDQILECTPPELRASAQETTLELLPAKSKQRYDGYKPKKSKTLTTEEINTFLNNAPDDKYLLSKVILAIGISGACRKQEIVQMKIDDIKDLNSAVIINIADTKTKQDRSFAMTGKFYEWYKKYAALRPSPCNERHLLVNYQNAKCTRQPVGIHKIAAVPKLIADFLGLKDTKLYTGHCFRRSSATMLVNAGGDITTLKRHGGWKSTSVAEGYIDKSITSKLKASSTLSNTLNECPEVLDQSTSSQPEQQNNINLTSQPSTSAMPEQQNNYNLINHTFAPKPPVTLINCCNNTITINIYNEVKR